MKTMNSFIISLLTLILGLYSITGWAQSASLAWQSGPSLPAVRAESSAIMAADQSIYLIGGHNATISRIVSKLSVDDSIWISAPDLDTSRLSPGVTRLGSNGILVIAGIEYLTDGHKWTTLKQIKSITYRKRPVHRRP